MSQSTVYRNSLELKSTLHEYRLESILGAGGFGMTYLAWDAHLEKHVAIKEYLPTELAVRALDGSVVPVTTEHEHDYKWGLDRFILEARTLAKFSHPHIVRVNRYFEANGTGYMVMDYEKGESMSELLRREPFPDEANLRAILLPLLDGLHAVHGAGFLHRDIKPGNIYIRENGSPVLLDFGAARHAIGGATKSITSVLTPGYAPLEQYSSEGKQGPWSDVYAMSGVVYRAITNTNPPDAVSRLQSDGVPNGIASARARYSEAFLHSVAWALTLNEKARPQSVMEWKRTLTGETRAPVMAATAAAPSRPAGNGVDATAPTVAAPARVASAPLTASPTTRPNPRSRPMPEPEPRSGWRWAGIAAAVIVAVVVLGGWNKQRTAEREKVASAQLEAERARTAQLEAERAAAEARLAQMDEARRRAEAELEAEKQEFARREAERRAAERVAAADAPKPVSVPLPPAAQRPEAPPMQSELRAKALQEFRSADRDGNGYLSGDEVARFSFISRRFSLVDVNGDGRISPDEFVRLREEQARMSADRKSR